MNYKSTITVNGHNMNVYITGNGRDTIVFLPGQAITSPVLEYKGLYALLADEYRIAVVEKKGYGFSDGNTGSPRDVKTMTDESREALARAGAKPPYIIAAHSYSGLEAIYWANTYPDEVKAVLGLDMVTPRFALAQAAELSEEKKRKMVENNEKLYRSYCSSKLLRFLLKNKMVGGTGMLKSGILTEEEKQLYSGLFHKNICNGEIFAEQLMATGNAETANASGKMKVPGHMFISPMKTYLKNTTWLAENSEFVKENGWTMSYAQSHFCYVQEPQKIADAWKAFLQKFAP